jgi:putative ABC transport system substrate-binding protein
MKRRDVLRVLGGAAVSWPRAAWTQQQQRLARVGYLAVSSADFHKPYSNAFREGLHALGYVEGENILIEARFAGGDNDQLPALAAELVRLNPDVIVTYATGTPAVQRATSTIPIVTASQADAVASGIVASLAHPGANVTGSTFFNPELMSKRLELMKEAIPSFTQAGVLLVRDNPANGPILRAMGLTATVLNVELHPFEIRSSEDLGSAFSNWAHNQQLSGLIIQDNGILVMNARTIGTFAADHRLPSIGSLELAQNGGLLAYGVSFLDQFRRAAVFVDKILKGAKPSDIPIEQASKFITFVNIKTAKILGLEMPISILLRADEVIE